MSERDERAMAVPIEDQAANLRAHYDDISLKASDWHNQIPVAIDLWERWKKGELVERPPVDPPERVSAASALREIAAMEHADTCITIVRDLPCDCHLGIARRALEDSKGEG